MPGPSRDDWLHGRRADALVVAVGAATLLPYVLAGPGHFLDDWFALRNAVTDGWWQAAGSGQWRARPGAGVVYALSFGLIGARPWVHATVAGVVIVATAIVLRRVLVRVVPASAALGVCLAWLLIPNHTSLEAWPSALNIALALLFLVAGIERLTGGPARLARVASSAALFAGSVLCYEATAPAAVATVLWVAWGLRSDLPAVRRLLGVHGLALASAGGWMLANWNSAKTGIDEWAEPADVLDGHIGTGVVGQHTGAVVLAALVLVTCVLAAHRCVTAGERGDRWPVQLIAGGWVLLVLGALPFVRYYYSPVGLGDRVTVVSGVGGAAVLMGVAGWLAKRNRPAVLVAAALVLGGILGHRVSLVRDYATAADDGRRILAAVEERWPTPPAGTIVFGPHPVMKRNIVAFIDADWPLQWLYGSRAVSAGFTLTDEAFEVVPEDRRVDVVALSDLEPLDSLAAP